MTLPRCHRRWLSMVLVVVLLFTQFATAAYACPRPASSVPAPVAMTAMPGCDGHMTSAIDASQPQLCKAHCEQGNQALNQAPVVDHAPAPQLLAVLDWSAALWAPMPASARAAQAPAGASPPGSPPLYISLLVLRN